MLTHLVTLQSFGPVWLLFALALVARPAGLWRGQALAVALGIGVVAAIGYAEFGRTGSGFFLYDALRRLLMTYVPLALLVIAAAQPVRQLFGAASPAPGPAT